MAFLGGASVRAAHGSQRAACLPAHRGVSGCRLWGCHRVWGSRRALGSHRCQGGARMRGGQDRTRGTSSPHRRGQGPSVWHEDATWRTEGKRPGRGRFWMTWGPGAPKRGTGKTPQNRECPTYTCPSAHPGVGGAGWAVKDEAGGLRVNSASTPHIQPHARSEALRNRSPACAAHPGVWTPALRCKP